MSVYHPPLQPFPKEQTPVQRNYVRRPIQPVKPASSISIGDVFSGIFAGICMLLFGALVAAPWVLAIYIIFTIINFLVGLFPGQY